MSQITLTPAPSIWREKLSIWRITQIYRAKLIFTWALLLLEATLELLFPLAIGFSVDGLLANSYTGLTGLGLLSVAVLIVGAGRRFYDTRVYAGIFQALANSLVAFDKQQNLSTSRVTARTNLLYELIEFLEDSLPTLIKGLVGFLGVLLIIGIIDIELMLYCLAATILIALVYLLTGRMIFRFNKHQNDELEQQVAVLAQDRPRRIRLHFLRLMKWNIKLSDLETVSFSVLWLILGSLLLGSIVLIVENIDISFGQKLTAIMYVFQYIEVVMSFPLFFQQIVRLSEISQRLCYA